MIRRVDRVHEARIRAQRPQPAVRRVDAEPVDEAAALREALGIPEAATAWQGSDAANDAALDVDES